jgi:hypothetical protein
MGSFYYPDSACTPHLSHRPSLAYRQNPVLSPEEDEDTVQFSPWTIQRLLHSFTLVLLCPTTHLDAITFTSGFVLPPPSDIARFGYWAENAIPHMCTFLAGLCFLIRWRLGLGLSALAVVLCLFWRAWSHFELDKDVPLGEDDRQTIYLVSMAHTLGDGHRFRASDGSFVDLPPGIKLSRGIVL